MAVSGLHRYCPSPGGRTGEVAVLRGRAGAELHRHRLPSGADSGVRTHLLQHHLSAGHHAGHLRMGGQEGQEEPLHLLEGHLVAPLWRTGDLHRGTGGWCRYYRATAGPLLRLRTHCHQSVATRLPGRQQRAGLDCRALRQLRLLSVRNLASFRSIIHYCRSNVRYSRSIGLAQRTNLLQHHLSCGHGTLLLQPLLVPEDSLRCGEVQELLALYQELQGLVYRL